MLKMLTAVALVLMTFAFKPVQLMAESTTVPTDLRCEFRENPSGIDSPKPRLSWKFKDSKIRGQGQSAYQILLASSEELLKADKGWLHHGVSQTRRQVASGELPADGGQDGSVRDWLRPL